MEWEYHEKPLPGKDNRKLVTLLSTGMCWVGVRVWNGESERWEVNGEPERDQVLAWMDLPEPADKRWVRGQLI